MAIYRLVFISVILLGQWLVQPVNIAQAQDTPGDQLISRQLKRWLTTQTFPAIIRVGGVKLHTSELIREMYEKRNYKPLWSGNEKIKPQMDQLISVIKSVELEALNPFDYHLLRIVQLLKEVKEEKKEHFQSLKVAALDLLLSDSFLTMTADLAYGRVSMDLDIRAPYKYGEEYNLVGLLEQAVKEEKLQDVIKQLRPPHEGFEQMRQYLACYRRLYEQGYWPLLTNREPIKKGTTNQIEVKTLREKLILLGDLEEVHAGADIFNDKMETALKQYQARHGLTPSGILDEPTRKLLNTPLNIFIKKMEINMERWRWLPRDLGKRYIFVNIPDFTVKVIENRKVVLEMKVVVGKGYTKTPIFSNRLRYIVINPEWRIPPKILIRTQLWKIRNQKNYFSKRKIKVIKGWGAKVIEINPQEVNWKKISNKSLYEQYRFIQAPGPKNPLGKIKFMFPNEYNVYLHGTNQPELFDKDIRDYSSGCIRLSEPLQLAAYCLKNQSVWTLKRLKGATNSDYQQKIRLTKPIAIHILYWTAWVDDDGRLQFRHDVYGRDKGIEQVFYQTSYKKT